MSLCMFIYIYHTQSLFLFGCQEGFKASSFEAALRSELHIHCLSAPPPMSPPPLSTLFVFIFIHTCMFHYFVSCVRSLQLWNIWLVLSCVEDLVNCECAYMWIDPNVWTCELCSWSPDLNYILPWFCQRNYLVVCLINKRSDCCFLI